MVSSYFGCSVSLPDASATNVLSCVNITLLVAFVRFWSMLGKSIMNQTGKSNYDSSYSTVSQHSLPYFTSECKNDYSAEEEKTLSTTWTFSIVYRAIASMHRYAYA